MSKMKEAHVPSPTRKGIAINDGNDALIGGAAVVVVCGEVVGMAVMDGSVIGKA